MDVHLASVAGRGSGGGRRLARLQILEIIHSIVSMSRLAVRAKVGGETCSAGTSTTNLRRVPVMFFRLRYAIISLPPPRLAMD
jgi:hypothetical protein